MSKMPLDFFGDLLFAIWTGSGFRLGRLKIHLAVDLHFFSPCHGTMLPWFGAISKCLENYAGSGTGNDD